jgi:rSAM/selenodomain-associated transferase 1
MSRRPHLVIFAKAPRRGQVKRRLAAGIGDTAALRFHCENTTWLLKRVAHDPRWRCWLALTPDGAAAPRHWRRGAICIPQGPGDLGRRMARPYTMLPPGPIIIIGSDIPGIAPRHLATAFRLLRASDFVLGPATDGGYWLFGSRRRPLPHDVFVNVRWSTEHALADTLASLPRQSRVAFAATLDDIDDAAAYRRWRALSRTSDAPEGAA